MSCHAYFTISIDGHNMTVIEADGVNTEPVTVDSIQIFTGQRYLRLTLNLGITG